MTALASWAVEDNGFHAPLRTLAGMRYTSVRPRALIQRMAEVDWLREADGAVTPAAGAIVADSTLGAAWASTLPIGTPTVTVRLTLELTGRCPPADGPLKAASKLVHPGDGEGLVTGEVTTANGHVIAAASLRGTSVPGGSTVGRTPQVNPTQAPPRGPVDAALGLQLAHGPNDRSTATWHSTPWFANFGGVLHGGMTAVVAAVALHRALGSPTAALLHLDVAYLRPLPCDGQRLVITTEVVSRSRRYANVHGRLFDAAARPAALVQATFGSG